MNPTSRMKLVVGGTYAVIALITACSDSMGPSAVQLAQHFDSLYSAAAAHQSIGYSIRAQILTELEIPSAFGTLPRVVNVNTANGVERWKGFEFMINPHGSQFESNDVLVLYRDADAHTVLVTSYAQDGSITSASLLANDTLRLISSEFSGSSALTSSHDGCPAPPQLVNSDLAAYALATCASADFTSSASAEFAIGPSVDAALSHLAFGSTVFPGETFTSTFGDRVPRVVH